MTNKVTGENFAQFQKEITEQLKSGQPLMGKEGVLTPLIKQFLEEALLASLYSEGFFKADQTNENPGRIKNFLKTFS